MEGVKKVKGFWVDKNNNCWDSLIYTQEEALEHSKSLVNCKDCINCENLMFCKGCRDCKDCYACKNCKDCKDCSFCDNCSACKDCGRCKNCKDYKERFDIHLGAEA